MWTKNIRDGLSVFCKSVSLVGNTGWLEMILCLGIHLELYTRRLKHYLFMCPWLPPSTDVGASQANQT